MGEEQVHAALRHRLAQPRAFGIAVPARLRAALWAVPAIALCAVLGLGCTGDGGPHPEPPNTHAGRPGGAAGRPAAGTSGGSSGRGGAGQAGAGGSFTPDAGPMVDGGMQCDEDAGVSACDDAGALD